jgi:hypothetical protein
MKWPQTSEPATIVATEGTRFWTDAKPWHGRSGGPLVDVETERLVGVVQGYVPGPGGQGLYVNHQTILQFLTPTVSEHSNRPRAPTVTEERRGNH